MLTHPIVYKAHSIAFNSIYKVDNKLYLYHAVSFNSEWNFSDIYLTILNREFDVLKYIPNPLIEGLNDTSSPRVTPILLKARGNYYLLFAYGRPRRVAISVSDAPEGPFKFLGDVLVPEHLWEMPGIDLGPGIVELQDDTFLIFYSNIGNPRWVLRLKCLYKLDLKSLFGKDLRKYTKRTIGIAKIKIRGRNLREIEVEKGPKLSHLNGPKGSWNESLFCPGYIELQGLHYLFPAASIYSIGYPYRQVIGLIVGRTYDFNPSSIVCKRVLLDPSSSDYIVKALGSKYIAVDTPSPIIMDENLHIVFSAAARYDYKWRIFVLSLNLIELQNYVEEAKITNVQKR